MRGDVGYQLQRVFRGTGFSNIEQIPFMAFAILPPEGSFIVSRVL